VTARLYRLPVLAPDPERPRTRGDCKGGLRPCPWVSCEHHLASEEAFAGEGEFDVDRLDTMRATCTLDVADEGGVSLETVAAFFDLTRERIRQIEWKGLRRFRANVGFRREWAPEELAESKVEAIERVATGGTRAPHFFGASTNEGSEPVDVEPDEVTFSFLDPSPSADRAWRTRVWVAFVRSSRAHGHADDIPTSWNPKLTAYHAELAHMRAGKPPRGIRKKGSLYR
jgi:hypothetical protein